MASSHNLTKLPLELASVCPSGLKANAEMGNWSGLNKALTRLSSGFRINMSGDDAAGLAVANRYRSDVAIIGQGIRNANDGLSELQIKDGALNNISNLLDRLATLSTQFGASHVVAGTWQDHFGKVRLDARVVEVATGRVTATASAGPGDRTNLDALVQRLAAGITLGGRE